MLAILAAGCVENQLGKPTTGGGDPPPPPAPTIEAAPAFDPLRAPLTVTVDGPPDAAVTLAADAVWAVEGTTDMDGRFVASWDGRDGAGTWAPSGAYAITAAMDSGEAATTAVSVRAGFLTAWLEGDGGATATRAPVYWPVDRVVATEDDPVAALDALDDGEVALDFPSVPSDDPLALRPSGAEPTAFTADSRPILTLSPAADAALALVDLTVEADGWSVLDGNPLRADRPVVLQLDAPLGDTVGVSDLDVDLTLRGGDRELGHQHLPLRIWRVLAPSTFQDPADPYRAWAPVLQEALPAIEGTPAVEADVLNALVDHVFYDQGLTYDTRSGASAYSAYQGFDFSKPHFLLSDYLVRRYGNTINCSDAANILGAWANMVGVPLDHLILDPSFDLNYIEAIGHTDFTHCPFGPGGCGFTYHAVTTIPDSLQIWDATLALDGDADPSSSPSTPLMVEQIPADEYLFRLVMSGSPRYNNEAQETLQ
jgi:hypothetical protein